MATFISLYTCHEIQIDKDDNFVKAFETNLPHSKEILDDLCENWNKQADFMLSLVNKKADNRISSCKMKPFRNNNGETTLAVHFVAKPGKQLTSRIKTAITDFMSAQYSDGWGESIFGLINIYTDSNGTRYYVD